MIMNPDVRLVMPVFRRAYEEFQKNEKCALLGMKQIIPGERGRSFSWSFRSSFWLGQLLYPFCVYFDVYLQEYMTIHGACFMVRKQIFEKYGLFDENIFMYGEEADIHWRMKIIGKNDFLYKKQLSYIHLHKSNEMRSYCMKNLILGLDSKLYLNKRDSLDESLVINMEILQTKLILLRMKIKSLLGYKNDKYYNATVEWLDYLKKIKCKY